MSFKDEILSAVREAQAEEDSGPAKAYTKILEDLASALGQLEVDASIRRGTDPRVRWLVLAALHRPRPAHKMLRFFFDGEAMTVSGEEPLRMHSPEALKQWLVSFVKLPAFRDSLEILKEEAKQPVEARLRVAADAVSPKDDVFVLVAPATQKTLSTTKRGDSVEVSVSRVEIHSNPPFRSALTYSVLDSSGIAVNVETVTSNDGGLTIDVKGSRALAS